MQSYTTTVQYATPKQFDFLKKLLAEKAIDSQLAADVATAREQAMTGRLTRSAASKLIDRLIAAPKGSQPEPDVEAGVFIVDGDYYIRVYFGQQSGRMLAKRIDFEKDGDTVAVSYSYLGTARSIFQKCDSWTRLTLDEVGLLGIASGQCLVCGRRLDDPESVDRGIGPVCASKY